MRSATDDAPSRDVVEIRGMNIAARWGFAGA